MSNIKSLLDVVSKTSLKSSFFSFFLPSKHTINFFENHLEVYSNKLILSLDYEKIQEISKVKTWKYVIMINAKPMIFNIYDGSEEIYNKIKEIIKK